MLDKAIEALKAYDWGGDLKALQPIDQAIVASHGDTAAREELESKLVVVLTSNASRAAKDFVCRKLRVIGTASSVPALAALLSDKGLSHMARFALERIPVAEAGKAMQDALPNLSGALKAGVLSSLGTRQDESCVEAVGELVGDEDATVARAAACALGSIRTPAAAKVLAEAKPKSPEVQLAATDASFAAAESLLADGKKLEALAIYKRLVGGDQAKHIRLAATRGMLACAAKG